MTSTEDVIETAALSRPFELGMLYDCRKDAIIPGISLWTKKQLIDKNEKAQYMTDFNVSTSDSIEEKANNLKVTADLKLSLLGGLVSVDGAARYFSDNKKSFKQERLTLHYRTTTRFEQLTMDQLAAKKIIHNEVFDHNTATHVVTAILYGAHATFVFDREVSSEEQGQNVKGEMKIAFDQIKKIEMGVEASVNISEQEKNVLNKLNCKFYGDFKLPSNPNTFEDAVKVFTDLPKMLGENGEYAVPLKVWLYPLIKLNSKAARLVRHITTDLIRAVETVIEALNITEMKCSDLLQSKVAKSFKAIHSQVQDFKKFCGQYKLDFMVKLGSLLPEIRAGKSELNALTDLLHAHQKSPFNERDVNNWIQEKEKDFGVVTALLQQLSDLGAEVDQDIDKYLVDLKVDNLACYTFTSLQQPDFLLTKQNNYLKPSKKQESNNDLHQQPRENQITIMRKNLAIFKNLKNCNIGKSTKFIVQSLSKTTEDISGSCILIYENGCEAVCFVPPNKPSCPVIENVTDVSISVKLEPPSQDTVEMKLLFKKQQEKDWESMLVQNAEKVVTITQLQQDTAYDIKCEAVGKLNYTVQSESICQVTATSKNDQRTKTKSTHQFVFANVCRGFRPSQDSVRTNSSISIGKGSGFTGFPNQANHNVKCFIYPNDKKVYEEFVGQLRKHTAELQTVGNVQESDFVLAFFVIAPNQKTSIKALLQSLQSIPETKPVALVVLHHTFNPEHYVTDSSGYVNKNVTVTVDCLFYEDKLLPCYKNDQSLKKIAKIINSCTVKDQT